ISAQTMSRMDKSAARLLVQLAASGTSILIEGKTEPPARPSGPAGAAETLIAADLAVRRPDGGLEITPAGQAHLARLIHSQNAVQIDPFLAQHLGLARDEIETAEGRIAVTIDTAESPLAWLA